LPALCGPEGLLRILEHRCGFLELCLLYNELGVSGRRARMHAAQLSRGIFAALLAGGEPLFQKGASLLAFSCSFM
jgi:hypothetical protein